MSVEELRRGAVAEAVRRHRLIAVLRRIEPSEALHDLVDDLAAAGVRLFEVTLDAPGAERELAAIRERLGHEHLVGAGTVRTLSQLEAAEGAAADFAVAPVLDTPLVEEAARRGLPFVPGAMTPTEVAAAWRAGATFVKVFPASAVGPAFVRELRGPMPECELIPTGGIDAGNADAFLEAGAVAVGLGGAIVRATAGERRALIEAIAR